MGSNNRYAIMKDVHSQNEFLSIQSQDRKKVRKANIINIRKKEKEEKVCTRGNYKGLGCERFVRSEKLRV